MHNQIELFNLEVYQSNTSTPIYDSAWNDTSVTLESPECVREQVFNDTCKSAPEHTHWVEEYWVKRSGKKHFYYRYCWMDGRKTHHCHIRGGNVNALIAIYRKLEIEGMIADGMQPSKIVNVIKNQFT